MGFLAPALPWIGKGIGLLGGWLGGRGAQNAAQQRSPEELAALNAATGAGQGLMRQGQSLTGMGTPAVQSSLNYYGTLLRGNRAAMSQATAGPRAALTDTYRGAERGLERSGAQGATKDLASAELSRDRAGKIASLVTGVQPAAAEAQGNLGNSTIGQGMSAYGSAGSIFSGLLGQGANNRQYARGEGEKAGSSIGSFLFDILNGGFGKKNGGVAGGMYGPGPTQSYAPGNQWGVG